MTSHDSPTLADLLVMVPNLLPNYILPLWGSSSKSIKKLRRVSKEIGEIAETLLTSCKIQLGPYAMFAVDRVVKLVRHSRLESMKVTVNVLEGEHMSISCGICFNISRYTAWLENLNVFWELSEITFFPPLVCWEKVSSPLQDSLCTFVETWYVCRCLRISWAEIFRSIWFLSGRPLGVLIKTALHGPALHGMLLKFWDTLRSWSVSIAGLSRRNNNRAITLFIFASILIFRY